MPVLTNRWAVVALLFFARACMAVQFQSIPPIASFLVEDLRLGYAMLGLLIGLFMLPGSFIALPGGMLGSRFGGRNVLLAGTALMALGALVFANSLAFGRPFLAAFLGRLLSGVGGVLVNVQLSRIVTDWFSGREITTAMAIQLSGWPLGIAAALATLGGLAVLSSWQAVMLGTAALPALIFLLVLCFYRDHSPATETAGLAAPRLWSIDAREAALSVSAGSVWSLWNAGFAVLFSFGPLMLIANGTEVARAGMVISIGSWLSIVSVPLGGWVIDRTGRLNLLLTLAVLASTTLIIVFPLVESILPFMVLYGILRGPGAGGINALPTEVLRPESRSTGFGIYFTTYYLTVALLPPLAGFLRDASGSAAAPVYFAGLLTLSSLLALLAFRILQRLLLPAAAPLPAEAGG